METRCATTNCSPFWSQPLRFMNSREQKSCQTLTFVTQWCEAAFKIPDDQRFYMCYWYLCVSAPAETVCHLQLFIMIFCIKFSYSSFYFLKYGDQCLVIISFYFLCAGCLKKWRLVFCLLFMLFYFHVIAGPCTSVFDEMKWEEQFF